MGLLRRLPPSSRVEEDRGFAFAHPIIACVKCQLVATACHAIALGQWGRPHSCTDVEAPLRWVGRFFVAYECVDLALMHRHSCLTAEYLFHHLVHIALGGFMLYKECMPRMVLLLLLQETSGICLNVYLFLRFRLARGHYVVRGAKAGFACAFVLYRIVLGAMALREFAACGAPGFAPVERVTFGALLLAGYGLQWYWALVLARRAAS
jgi:hypothetical protein